MRDICSKNEGKIRDKSKTEYIIILICIAAILWILMSVIDVDLHNMSDHKFAWWNLFVIFTRS